MSLAERGKGEDGAMPSKFIVTANTGDVLRLEMPGGGGWGDPLDRDPLRVLDDVVAEKVSQRRAEDVYGVVIGKGGRAVDGEATERLRATRRKKAPRGDLDSAPPAADHPSG